MIYDTRVETRVEFCNFFFQFFHSSVTAARPDRIETVTLEHVSRYLYLLPLLPTVDHHRSEYYDVYYTLCSGTR